MMYKLSENSHNERFIDVKELLTEMLHIFQSGYDVINQRLNLFYNFDIKDNSYKYYLPNLIRNNGLISKNQMLYIL